MSDEKSIHDQYRVLKTLDAETVDGKCCIYFAWAPPGFTGPHGEKDECRPQPIVIEEPVDQVRVTVQPTDPIWYHGSGSHERANANGRSKTEKTRDAYSHKDYNSEDIELLDTNLCKLVALYSVAEPPTEIGVGPEYVNVPGDPPKTLWLGMHDGYQWNNNGGTQTVVVELVEKIEK